MNLEKVHEATVRQIDNAVDTTTGAAVGPSRALMDADEGAPMVGPILDSAVTDDTVDPYNLPITHEVTLEGDSVAQ